MSANSVLPPFGFTMRADSSENFAGIGRNELSECHRQLPRLNRCARWPFGSGLPSLPRLETSFRPVWSRESSGLTTLPPRGFSRSPKFSAKAICCSSVMSWLRNSSTAYLSMPASISAASCRVSGFRKSTPETSPKKCLCNWRMATGMAGSLMVLLAQKLPPQRAMSTLRHACGIAPLVSRPRCSVTISRLRASSTRYGCTAKPDPWTRAERPGPTASRPAGRAAEELQCDFLDLVPGIGDMRGAGLAELEVMAVPDMRCGAQAHGRHAGSHGSLDAAGAVFDDEAGFWAHFEPVGGKQEQVRMRLAARHHVCAEDMAVEFFGEIEDRKTKLQAVDRAGGRDAPGYVRKRLNKFAGSADLLQLCSKPIEDCDLQVVRKSHRQRLADHGGDRRHRVIPSSPGIVLE